MTPPATALRQARPAIDAEEWRLRVELAAGYRLIDHFGWSELIWSHTTLRVPGPEHHFLINPYGLRYDQVTASNLVKIDVDGNIVGPSDYPVNPAGFVIHSAIHMARENAHCVLHTHTVAGMAVAACEDGLLPISMYALGFHGQVAYHDFEGPSLDTDERSRLGASLGDKDLLILRNHGLLTCGRTVAEAFINMYRLQRACEIQLAAHATGSKLIMPSQAVRENSAKLNGAFLTADGTRGFGSLEFAALMDLMDKKDPSYRQ